MNEDVPPGEKAYAKVILAHVICTYRREGTVFQKIELLKPLLSESYRIIVVDNGSTLPETDEKYLKIIHSPNYGGSAGFARGMMESLKTDATHILLNDDDAEVEPDAIHRTLEYLSRLPPEKKDVCICGIMLDSDNPNIVYEAGAQVSDGDLVPLKHGANISTEAGLLALEEQERIDFANWTYFCVPVSLVKEHGLPLPMFVREDDVEYGLRLKAEIVTVPGVYVKHPTYTSDYNPVNYYHYVRNRLAALCCSGNPDISILNKFFDEMATEACSYRYLSCEQMIQGMKDFLRGPDHVFMQCRDGMHSAERPRFENLSILRGRVSFTDSVPEEEFSKRRRSLNGVFKRSIGDIETTPFDMDSAHFYRVGKVLYRVNEEKGFIAERKVSKAISYAIRITLLKRKAMKLFPKLKEEYRRSRDRFTTEEFWMSLFGDNPEER